MGKTWEEIGAELRKPFAPDQIEWRLAQAGETDTGKPWAKALAYLTNRAIMDRLDATVGCGNWWNEYRTGPDGGVICGISIYSDAMTVTKWDGAGNSEIESVKGGLSDSMKRAAVQWGIGRYLYGLDEGWAICSAKKENGPEWRYQPAKNGRHGSFYWSAPELPQWALPEDTKAKTKRTKPDLPPAGEQAKPEPAVREDNPYGIPGPEWLKLDACKSYDELYQMCGMMRENSRGDNPSKRNWNVGLNTFWKERSAFLKDLEREVFGND